ncbi:COPII coat assembly protein sec16 (Protein transport protein sec16) [Durusdinium trenchii]|uniref:Protein transport protein sec16 n=1 Tax=Durusdinium trenchii TaxID=1381693 RepID=A0ABP0IQB8_9DINO
MDGQQQGIAGDGLAAQFQPAQGEASGASPFDVEDEAVGNDSGWPDESLDLQSEPGAPGDGKGPVESGAQVDDAAMSNLLDGLQGADGAGVAVFGAQSNASNIATEGSASQGSVPSEEYEMVSSDLKEEEIHHQLQQQQQQPLVVQEDGAAATFDVPEVGKATAQNDPEFISDADPFSAAQDDNEQWQHQQFVAPVSPLPLQQEHLQGQVDMQQAGPQPVTDVVDEGAIPEVTSPRGLEQAESASAYSAPQDPAQQGTRELSPPGTQAQDASQVGGEQDPMQAQAVHILDGGNPSAAPSSASSPIAVSSGTSASAGPLSSQETAELEGESSPTLQVFNDPSSPPQQQDHLAFVDHFSQSSAGSQPPQAGMEHVEESHDSEALEQPGTSPVGLVSDADQVQQASSSLTEQFPNSPDAMSGSAPVVNSAGQQPNELRGWQEGATEEQATSSNTVESHAESTGWAMQQEEMGGASGSASQGTSFERVSQDGTDAPSSQVLSADALFGGPSPGDSFPPPPAEIGAVESAGAVFDGTSAPLQEKLSPPPEQQRLQQDASPTQAVFYSGQSQAGFDGMGAQSPDATPDGMNDAVEQGDEALFGEQQAQPHVAATDDGSGTQASSAVVESMSPLQQQQPQQQQFGQSPHGTYSPAMQSADALFGEQAQSSPAAFDADTGARASDTFQESFTPVDQQDQQLPHSPSYSEQPPAANDDVGAPSPDASSNGTLSAVVQSADALFGEKAESPAVAFGEADASTASQQMQEQHDTSVPPHDNAGPVSHATQEQASSPSPPSPPSEPEVDRDTNAAMHSPPPSNEVDALFTSGSPSKVSGEGVSAFEADLKVDSRGSPVPSSDALFASPPRPDGANASNLEGSRSPSTPPPSDALFGSPTKDDAHGMDSSEASAAALEFPSPTDGAADFTKEAFPTQGAEPSAADLFAQSPSRTESDRAEDLFAQSPTKAAAARAQAEAESWSARRDSVANSFDSSSHSQFSAAPSMDGFSQHSQQQLQQQREHQQGPHVGYQDYTAPVPEQQQQQYLGNNFPPQQQQQQQQQQHHVGQDQGYYNGQQQQPEQRPAFGETSPTSPAAELALGFAEPAYVHDSGSVASSQTFTSQHQQHQAFAAANEQQNELMTGVLPRRSSAGSYDLQQVAMPGNTVIGLGDIKRGDGRPPHAFLTWGFGGRVMTMKPQRRKRFSSIGTEGSDAASSGAISGPFARRDSTEGSGIEKLRQGNVRIYNVRDILKDEASAKRMREFPGPLVCLAPGNKAADMDAVMEFLREEVAQSADASVGFAGRILWEVILVLLNGSGDLQNPVALQELLESLRRKHPGEPEAPIGTAAKLQERFHVGNSMSDESLRSAMSDIEALLVAGDREGAVVRAVESELWAQALVISNFVSVAAYRRVVERFVNSTMSSDTNSHALFMLFAGLGEKALAGRPSNEDVLQVELSSGTQPGSSAGEGQEDSTGINHELCASWKQTLAAILANRTPGDSEVLTSLGDRLWAETGSVEAAHVCYLVAGVAPTSTSGSRIVLVGGDHKSGVSHENFVTSRTIQRTEAYYFAQTLRNPTFRLDAFHPYRLVYAMWLADLGAVEKAYDWVRSIQDTVKLRSPSKRSSSGSSVGGSPRKGGGPFPTAFQRQLKIFADRLMNCESAKLGIGQQQQQQQQQQQGGGWIPLRLTSIFKSKNSSFGSATSSPASAAPAGGGNNDGPGALQPPTQFRAQQQQGAPQIQQRQDGAGPGNFGSPFGMPPGGPPQQQPERVEQVKQPVDDALTAKPPGPPLTNGASIGGPTTTTTTTNNNNNSDSPGGTTNETAGSKDKDASDKSEGSSKRGSGKGWGFSTSLSSFKEKVLHKMIPTKNIAKGTGTELNAYFDEAAGRWVFDGADEQGEPEKPKAPPKMSEMARPASAPGGGPGGPAPGGPNGGAPGPPMQFTAGSGLRKGASRSRYVDPFAVAGKAAAAPMQRPDTAPGPPPPMPSGPNPFMAMPGGGGGPPGGPAAFNVFTPPPVPAQHPQQDSTASETSEESGRQQQQEIPTDTSASTPMAQPTEAT